MQMMMAGTCGEATPNIINNQLPKTVIGEASHESRLRFKFLTIDKFLILEDIVVKMIFTFEWAQCRLCWLFRIHSILKSSCGKKFCIFM